MLRDSLSMNNLGVLLSLLGSLALARGLLISKSEAVRLGQSYWSGGDETDKLKLPPVADRIRQSRYAILGIALLVVGTSLQLASTQRSSSPLAGRWVIISAGPFDDLAPPSDESIDSLARKASLGVATIDAAGAFQWQLPSTTGSSTRCTGSAGIVSNGATISTDCFLGRFTLRRRALLPADTLTHFILVRSR